MPFLRYRPSELAGKSKRLRFKNSYKESPHRKFYKTRKVPLDGTIISCFINFFVALMVLKLSKKTLFDNCVHNGVDCVDDHGHENAFALKTRTRNSHTENFIKHEKFPLIRRSFPFLLIVL